MVIFRFLHLSLFVYIYGIAFTSVAATPLTVKLYLPDNFDANRNQIPNSRPLTETFSYFEREAGLKFVIVTLPWKRAQLEAIQGHGILYGFSKSAERLAQYHFSQPVITLHVWAISYGTGNTNLADLSDLKGKIVLSGLGLSHGIEYEKTKNNLFSVQEDFATDTEHLKRLMTKPNDLILWPFRQQLNRKQVATLVNDTLIPGFRDPALVDKHFNISTNPIFYDTVHFATGKGHLDEVIRRIDLAIQKGVKNGSLSKVLQKYQ